MARTFLTIDDDRIIQKLLAMFLKRGGNEVTITSSAAEGLKLLAERHFDLITCDLMMPDISGIQFLEKVKADARFARIPVVIISATGHQEEIDQAYKLGAEAVVTKPFRSEDLEAILTRVFGSNPGS
jgi:CheY-like chemotaxis protein